MNQRTESLQEGIARLHQTSLHNQIDLDSKRRGGGGTGNYYVFRRGNLLFNWSDHPSLVTDAVENGWSRFGFTGGYMSSPSSTKSTLLGLCAPGDYRRESDTEISWEVCQGSADFMQKIRLNSGLKKVNSTSVIRTALPLPGPPLGNSAFPQEAYFEITILYCREDEFESSMGKIKEGEKAKLIQEKSSANAINKAEELKVDHGGKEEEIAVSLGLTVGGPLPFSLPGSYPASIGFNSDGSVYLDGTKLVFESEKVEWKKNEKIIGCGFNPKQKKVFFTVNSELVHVIHCKSEEFGSPLYPTLAANIDILVLVNFGQSVFSYAPANTQRTANPCFIGPLVNSPNTVAALGYEDSKELFSMGRIDSQWFNRSVARGYNNNNNSTRTMEFDEESDNDLFEIVLESRGRSPNTGFELHPVG